LCAILAGLALATAAHAESTEFWPEVSFFKQFGETKRLYLDATYARGKESPVETLDASAYLDISIQPIYRPYLQSADWQRNRYLWARLGYTRVSKVSLGTRELSENRGVVALHARYELPAAVWLEGRARADLRWIDGSYSTRYRFRVEASREFNAFEHAVVPYAHAEWFYDTRYDARTRSLYQAGVEAKLTRHFRVETYLAWQYDAEPQQDSLRALGLVAKWYY
jgi:hypothetical protein